MDAASPRLADLPDRFPVFPLAGALLLPRGRLPLNIFEPRYLAMTEDALAGGRLLGMIQPELNGPPADSGPRLYRVGCLGRICAFSETEDGRYLITLAGVIRFTVAAEAPMRRGYRRVRATLAPFAADLAPASAEPVCDRTSLLGALHGYFAGHGIEANWDALRTMPDDMLVTTLCMACPFGVAEKQALLEAHGAAERAAALRTLLAIEAHADHDQAAARAS